MRALFSKWPLGALSAEDTGSLPRVSPPVEELMASAWRVPLTLIHIKGCDVWEQMSRSGDDTWRTAHSTAGRKVCWEVSISSSAAEGMTPCCEIMSSRSVPSGITPADTPRPRRSLRSLTFWPVNDHRPPPPPFPLSTRAHLPSIHSGSTASGYWRKRKQETETRLWATSVGKHKHFLVSCIINQLSRGVFRTGNLCHPIAPPQEPPALKRESRKTDINIKCNGDQFLRLLLLVLYISARASWNQYSSLRVTCFPEKRSCFMEKHCCEKKRP